MAAVTARTNLATLVPAAPPPLRAIADALPAAVLPEESWRDAPLTWLGTALDRLALRGMRLAFTHALWPAANVGDAARASAEPYLTTELRDDPRAFFGFLDAPGPAARMKELRRRPIAGGAIVTRELGTAYAPYHCSGTWPACVENDRIVIEHWQHDDAPRATMIALHGFTMGSTWIDAHVLMAAKWFELGFDVALMALPFHGPRSPATARYSGELFASWDVGRTNEAVRQAIHDVDVVKRWLVAEAGRPVGLLGLSLGGYVTALMAGLCDDLAFAIPLVPPVTLDALASSLFALDRKRGTLGLPVALSDLRAAYAVHCPLTYPLAVPAERVLIVGARGDRIVPPEHAYALWRHWGEPAIHWYSGSHIAPFRRARLIARVAEHLDGLDLRARRSVTSR